MLAGESEPSTGALHITVRWQDKMKYDIHLFEQLNEEYRSTPVSSFTWSTDSDSLFKRGRSMLARLSKMVSLEGMRVLDVGCGRGYLSAVLAGEHSCSVTGIDIEEREEWDSLRGSYPDLHYRVLDLSRDNPFEPASFDLIVSFVTWEHVIHPFTMLKQCNELLTPSGQMYLDVNPYRSPTGSHQVKDVFFPFPHLLFGDEVFVEYHTKHTGKPGEPARLNKLTYSHYREYFRVLGLEIEHEHLRKIPLDREFYDRFKDKLELYPVFDLELNGFAFLLRKGKGASLSSTRNRQQRGSTMIEDEVQAVRNSFSYRLGNMLVEAVAVPGRNTVMLPYRLLRLGILGLTEATRRHHLDDRS